MTREEAIKVIENRDSIMDYCESAQLSEALDMAIEALSAEPCDDAISRQAVLDLVADYDLSMGQVVRGIHALPPVTPKQKMRFDGMTNGEVIQTLFPSCKTRHENTPMDNFMEFTLDGVVGYAIEKSWWNAPYKTEKGGE